MTVNTAKVTDRRSLKFKNLDELIVEAERVTTTPCKTLGNWTVGQILQHLALASRGPYEGFGVWRPSLLMRWFVAPFIKNSIITKGMPAGIKLPAGASEIVPAADVPPDRALAALKQVLARYKNEVPQFRHPIFGKLAKQEWVSLALRHAELHLSFIIPQEVAKN